MNRIFLVVLLVVLVIGGWILVSRMKPETEKTSPPAAETAQENYPAEENPVGTAPAVGQRPVGVKTGLPTSKGGTASVPESQRGGTTPSVGKAGSTTAGTTTTGSTTTGAKSATLPATTTKAPALLGPITQKMVKVAATSTPVEKKTEANDGVDGTPMVAQPGDDGDMPPPVKPVAPQTLAGVRNPKVWLVAADLKSLPAAKGRAAFEVGVTEGSKSTAWKNRSGTKFGDSVRVKSGTNATFVPGLSTSIGSVDAVALCAPGAKECINSAPSQLKLGVDLNHADHWLSGEDKTGKTSRGGGSFTALFVAARGAAVAMPLMEHMNGDAGASRGPFLGWIGADLVGSVHGTQGIVGVNAAAIANPFEGSIVPQIYALRFNRKKSEFQVFVVGSKTSAVQAQSLEKGDGPDNDQYAAIAMGSKIAGKGAAAYVLEAATFSRALEDREMCAIHKEWNRKYQLKISEAKLKPCAD